MRKYDYKWHVYLRDKYLIKKWNKDNWAHIASQFCNWGCKVIALTYIDDKIVILYKVNLRRRIKTAFAAWKYQRERRKING